MDYHSLLCYHFYILKITMRAKRRKLHRRHNVVTDFGLELITKRIDNNLER
jgi:hypothetical protein